jgi:regulatory protein
MVRQKLRELNYPNRRPARNSKSDHTPPPKQPAKPADPIPPAVIDQVVQRLTELELLDDRAYGQMLIRDLTRGKPAGPALLKQKLYAKGLDRKLIDELVAEATDDPDQQAEDATDFARKKARSMRHLEPEKQKRRLYGQLARRGFAPDAIRTAMDAALDELNDEPSDF